MGYTLTAMIIGVVLNSCIVGSITSLLGSLDDRAAKQKIKLDTINAFMLKNRVAPDLCEQVRQYFKYPFASLGAHINGGLFDDLSNSLKLKLDLSIHKKFIKQCHIFDSCPPACVVMLVRVISHNPTILVPTEVLFKKGDIGEAMYFLAKGEIVMYDPGGLDESALDIEALLRHGLCGAKLLKEAKAGDFFGELALLVENNRRAASATARTFAELLSLPRSDFDKVLLQHPTFAEQLQQQLLHYYGIKSPRATPPIGAAEQDGLGGNVQPVRARGGLVGRSACGGPSMSPVRAWDL